MSFNAGLDAPVIEVTGDDGLVAASILPIVDRGEIAETGQWPPCLRFELGITHGLAMKYCGASADNFPPTSKRPQRLVDFSLLPRNQRPL